MRCEEVVERLADYSADLLGRRTRSAIGQHLAQCRACAAEYRALMDVVALVGSMPKPEPPAHLWPMVRARIAAVPAADRRTAPGWFARRRTTWKTAAAFGAAVAASALLWLRVSTYTPQTAEQMVPAQAPYVRAHLQYGGTDPLSGSAGMEPLIILAGRTAGASP